MGSLNNLLTYLAIQLLIYLFKIIRHSISKQHKLVRQKIVNRHIFLDIILFSLSLFQFSDDIK